MKESSLVKTWRKKERSSECFNRINIASFCCCLPSNCAKEDTPSRARPADSEVQARDRIVMNAVVESARRAVIRRIVTAEFGRMVDALCPSLCNELGLRALGGL